MSRPPAPRRPLILNAFEGNTVGNVQQGMWAHPRDDRLGFGSLKHWLDRARRYEDARFDAVFFADVLGLYDTYRGSSAPAIENAVEFPAHDPLTLIPAMAAVSENLGFVVTASTSYEHPFANARRWSSLDHLTGGRVGWNIVTSYLPSAARNFGLTEQWSHDDRYDRAEEFLEISYKLWEKSWDEDAVVADIQRSVYAEADRIHAINHVGRTWSVAGPHLVEPSAQRTPLLFQAGTSGRGVQFAGKHAEVVFLGTNEVAGQLKARENIEAAAVAAGRNPEDVRLLGGLQVVVGKTHEQAQARLEEYQNYLSREGALAHWCGVSGRDLDHYDEDTVFEKGDTDHVQTQAKRFSVEGGNARTVGQLKQHFGTLGSYVQPIVGTPEEVVDEIERRATEGRIDGFNVQPIVQPETFDDFIEHILPRLRERGLARESYGTSGLRERVFGSPRLPATHPAHQVSI
ncbi:LLM class flavin-dependent oxidoreductase [Mycetocola saprophilus]|uniref:LLM class flavin-dependent oxidoreductase n=1 Tax=Mycetocola saprophilus TaxID=76636 RepID=UPI003BF418EF